MARNQVVKTYSLSPKTVERINLLADETHRDYSTIVEMAVELLSSQDEFAHLQPAALPVPTLADIPVRKGTAA